MHCIWLNDLSSNFISASWVILESPNSAIIWALQFWHFVSYPPYCTHNEQSRSPQLSSSHNSWAIKWRLDGSNFYGGWSSWYTWRFASCSKTNLHRNLRLQGHEVVAWFRVMLPDCSASIDQKGFRKYIIITYVYSTMMLIALTPYAISCLSVFNKTDEFDSLFSFKLAYVVTTIEAMGRFIGFYVASSTYERLPKFFIEWEKIRRVCPKSHALIIKLTTICTTVVWIFVLSSLGFSAYLAICTDSLAIRLAPLINVKEHPYEAVVIIANLILEFYLNFAWIAPSALMFLFCKILAIEFDHVKKTVKDLGRNGHLTLFRNMEGARKHHDKLCILVVYADNLFSVQIAVSFAGSVVTTCLTLYIFIVDTISGIIFTLTQCVFLMAAVVKVLIDCISGAMINGAVYINCRFN